MLDFMPRIGSQARIAPRNRVAISCHTTLAAGFASLPNPLGKAVLLALGRFQL